MKKNSNIYNLILTVVSFLISIALYNKLPDLMPMHWNATGEIDSYGSKLLGAFLLPVIMIVTWIGLLFAPKIDPKKDNYSKFTKSYTVISNLLVTFFFVLHIVIIGISLGYNIPMSKVVAFMVGILFIVLGNYLPKSKSNFFYGIKTPWTLTNEETWKKTHRLGGKLFVLSGLVIMITSLLFEGHVQFIILMISIFASSIIPTIASYFYSKNSIK